MAYAPTTFIILSLAVLYCLFDACCADHWTRKHDNIYGDPLQICSLNPRTGYYRDGKCTTGYNDRGTHVVCAEMTEDFLTFTKAQGNDLSTPRSWGFPGLNPGDKWCLCAARWYEAYQNGKAPLVVPEATNKVVFDHIFGWDVEDFESVSIAANAEDSDDSEE